MTLEITPQVAPSPVAAAERRFRRLIDRARTSRRPLIQLQHNPDPDALASGHALRHLLKRLLRLDPVVAFTGSVGRAENRAMMRYLRIQIVPAFKVRYGHHDLVIVVDTHPGAGTCRVPEGIPVDVVVDHHPSDPALHPKNGKAGRRPERLDLVDIDYGATSTLVGEMFLANGVAVPKGVATALCYGIQTDTLDLARNASPADERVFAALYALADKRLLGRIQRARVPQSWFVALERGLRRARVRDSVAATHLGTIEHPDFVAEMADLLFRLEGVQWSFVTGSHGRVLYVSIRTVDEGGGDAGAVARVVAGEKGSGGGHESLAAAQVPVAAGRDPEAIAEEALERFLAAVGTKKSSVWRPLATSNETAGEEGD